MKLRTAVLMIFIAAAAVFYTACPSPLTSSGTGIGSSSEYSSTAEVVFDEARGVAVFVEEDGSETPIVAGEDGEADGPVEIIDFTVLDDLSDAGRFTGSQSRIRCIVIGRRADGRSGVWIIYRRGGVVVLPNEDGDSALMEMVEVQGSPYLGDGWIYDARAISSDGRIIIGSLSRPDGWEYLDESAPEPNIGVWWSIHESDSRLVVSRARPILLMNEPQPASAGSRHLGHRIRQWLEMLAEWLQSQFLIHAWNYLSDAEGFVSAAEVEGGIPADFYVVAGPDKYGVDSWAWITARSVENIVVAPDAPDENLAPYDLTTARPTEIYYYVEGQQSQLLVDGSLTDPADDITDPDGDSVTYHFYDEDGSTMPDGWSLDSVTGVISFPVILYQLGAPTSITLSFYTSDGLLESNPVPITFSLKTANEG